MTSDYRTRARELLEKATPGPWAWDEDFVCLGGFDANAADILYTDEQGCLREEDAALIAAAPELLAALLAELDATEARIARLEEALRPLAACCEFLEPGDETDDVDVHSSCVGRRVIVKRWVFSKARAALAESPKGTP